MSLAVYLKLYRRFPHRLGMYIVCSSMLSSIVRILQLASLADLDACKVIGAFRQYCSSLDLLFTVWFTFHFFFLAVLQRNFEQLECFACLFSILFPLIIVWIPYVFDAYGFSLGWCGITSSKCHTVPTLILQVSLWYGPLIILQNLNAIAIIITIVVLAYRSCFLNKTGENEPLNSISQRNALSNKKALKELLPLLAYPVIFYILTVFPIVDRIYHFIYEEINFYLVLIHAVTTGLWGLNCCIAQLIHILLNKRIWRVRKSSIYLPEAEQTLCAPAHGESNDFISYRYPASTYAKTYYSQPKESVIDN